MELSESDLSISLIYLNLIKTLSYFKKQLTHPFAGISGLQGGMFFRELILKKVNYIIIFMYGQALR